MKITINPGHDRNLDSGAVGFNLRECDVAWQIGEQVAQLLKNAGHNVNLIQNDSLDAVCNSSNKFDSNIFVSIHCNAFNGRAKGTEVYYYPGSWRGQRLSAAIQKEIVNSLATSNRGCKTANFYVLKNTICTAVLVETAFIDNIDDNQLLKTKQPLFAAAITRGILAYISNLLSFSL